MSNQKEHSALNDLMTGYIIYVFRWPIIIILIVVVIFFWWIFHDLNKEYKENGYTGLWDKTVEYDDWTGEIIPKDELDTYNNDNKYIKLPSGEKVYFYQIKQKIEEFEAVQGENDNIITTEEQQQLDPIVKAVVTDYFGIEFTWSGSAEKNSFNVSLENYDGYPSSISSISDFRLFVNDNVKRIYEEQNKK